MFDRIAGLYDRMNSVMTAGLHHEWRRRAADLAELSPGDRALDVATGTGDLAFELADRVGPGRRGGRSRLRRADARAGSGQGRRTARDQGALRVGRTRWRCPTRTASSTPPPSASGPATSATSQRGLSEMARVVRPGGRVVILEITTPAPSAAVDFLRPVVRPRRPGARADCRLRGVQLPAEFRQALPRTGAAGRADVGSRAARDPLRPYRRRHHRLTRRSGSHLMSTGAQAVVDAGGAALTRIMDRVEQRMAELAVGHGPLLARYAGDTISAGGKRLRPSAGLPGRRRSAA